MSGERWHGTVGGYTNHRCRCASCRSAHTAYQREAKVRRQHRLAVGEVEVPHGVYSTYTNYGCRCVPCVAANTKRAQTWRARRAAS